MANCFHGSCTKHLGNIVHVQSSAKVNSNQLLKTKFSLELLIFLNCKFTNRYAITAYVSRHKSWDTCVFDIEADESMCTKNTASKQVNERFCLRLIFQVSFMCRSSDLL